MSRALTAADILGANDLKRGTVDVPEWGGTVHVRELSLGERLAFSEAAKADGRNATGWLVAAGATDPAGAALFAPEHVPALMARNAAAVQRVAEEVLRLSGMLEGAAEDAAGN